MSVLDKNGDTKFLEFSDLNAFPPLSSPLPPEIPATPVRLFSYILENEQKLFKISWWRGNL